MAYFTAVLARSGGRWRARDVEIDGDQTLDELADAMRAVADDDEPALAIIEHEDEWFALARVDGDDDPRLFVSDLSAASHSSFADLLAPVDDLEPPEPGFETEDDSADEPADDRPAVTKPGGGRMPQPAARARVNGSGAPSAAPAAVTGSGGDVAAQPGQVEPDPDGAAAAADELWAGDLAILEDLGVSAGALRELVLEGAQDPASVLFEVGERVGFGEVLEVLR